MSLTMNSCYEPYYEISFLIQFALPSFLPSFLLSVHLFFMEVRVPCFLFHKVKEVEILPFLTCPLPRLKKVFDIYALLSTYCL